MPAIKNKPKSADICPLCYQANLETELQYRPGSKFMYFCERGHEYDDREALSNLMMKIAKVRGSTSILATPDPAADLEPVPETETPKAERAPAPPPPVGLLVNEIDQARLKSVLGNFTDSSSLYGAVFALNEELKDLKSRVERLNGQKELMATEKLGGDMPITVLIPEAHVQTLKDTAAGFGMSVEKYMTERVAEGLKNYWYS
jgi:hypothetical protein